MLPEYPHIEYKYYLKKVSMFPVSLKLFSFEVETTLSQSVIFGRVEGCTDLSVDCF